MEAIFKNLFLVNFGKNLRMKHFRGYICYYRNASNINSLSEGDVYNESVRGN